MWALGARPGTGPISLFNSMQRGMFRAKKPSRVQGRSRSVANWETWWAGLQRLNRRRDPHRTDYVGLLNFTEDAHAKVHPLSEFYRVVSQRPPRRTVANNADDDNHADTKRDASWDRG